VVKYLGVIIMEQPTKKELKKLFLIFAKIGCVTFGGGYAILPVIEREIIKKYGWITSEEVLQFYSIAQVTPGIIAVNISTFVGYRRKGVAGGIASTLGFALPTVTLVVIAALLIKNFATFELVQHAFAGIRLAVGALILDTVCKMVRSLFIEDDKLQKPLSPASRVIKNIVTIFIFIVSFLLNVVLGLSPVLIVLGAGLCGLIIFAQFKSQ
jgi:chromate transporter